MRVTAILVEPDRAGLEALAGLVASRELRPHVSQTFPLEDAASAHEAGETGARRASWCSRSRIPWWPASSSCTALSVAPGAGSRSRHRWRPPATPSKRPTYRAAAATRHPWKTSRSTRTPSACARSSRSGPERAVLVGYSMGGVVITQAADRCTDKVAHLVFVCAFMPSNGQSLLDMTQLPESDDQIQANLTIEGDPPVAILSAEATAKAIYNDCTSTRSRGRWRSGARRRSRPTRLRSRSMTPSSRRSRGRTC